MIVEWIMYISSLKTWGKRRKERKDSNGHSLKSTFVNGKVFSKSETTILEPLVNECLRMNRKEHIHYTQRKR